MLRAEDPGVRLAVGRPKAGKTYSIRQEIIAAAELYPVIVIDRCFEWRREPYSRIPRRLAGAACWVTTVEAATRQIARNRMRLVVVNPEDTPSAAEAACRWARQSKGMAGVAIHEAHQAFPNGKPLAPFVMDAATAFRHFGISLWLDTQRLALLNRTFDLAPQVRLFAAADADRKVIREIGGPELETAVLEAGRRLAAGNPGWHVLLDEGRTPPYRLVRV